MSAVPTEITLGPDITGPVREPRGDTKLPVRATIYFFFIAVAAAIAALPLLTHLRITTEGWITFIILGSAAAFAQLFVVRTPRNQSYHTTIVFLIPAVMLLPPSIADSITTP